MTNISRTSPRYSVLILLSGGIDSASCAYFYKENDFNVEALFIDYGQPAALQEIQAAKKIAKHCDIKLKCIKLVDGKDKYSGEIISRNAFLVFTALMECEKNIDVIALG